MRTIAVCLALLVGAMTIFPEKALALRQCITRGGDLFATSEEALQKAIRYAVQKDSDALMQLVASKRVGILKAGMEVFIEDSSLLSGTVQIRVKGVAGTVWTVYEGIECK